MKRTPYCILVMAVTAVYMLISSWALLDYPYSNALPEICDNALDDDLDGLIDLNDPCWFKRELLARTCSPPLNRGSGLWPTER